MKIKDILAIVAVALMAVGCSSDDGLQPKQGRVPISLTASIGSEVKTRGYQEESLVEDEVVYVWGNQEGSDSYDYLKAWTLTADGSDGWKSGYTHKYYPLSGETLTMVALHGNFSYTEGDALPTTISHSVETDQTVAGNYEKSDLLWATESGSNEDATGKSLAFTHKLSKIEVKLHPGEGYSDISSAEVRLRGVLPTTAIDPTNGSLSSASGTAAIVKARLTEDHLSEATPYAVYEAIIPPQASPTGFLNIKIGDKIASVAADVASFASNKRYFYDITLSEFKVSVTSSIANWGSGVNADVTKNKAVQIGRPKLPIEYCAEYNMMSATEMAPDNHVSNIAYFYWGSSTSTMSPNISNFTRGITISGKKYHLPSKKEWVGVVGNSTWGESPYIGYGLGIFSDIVEDVAWGVNNNNGSYSYDVNRSFYNDYDYSNTTARIGYGLRFRERVNSTTVNGIYTCAYRYEYVNDAEEVGNATSYVKVKYIGANQNVSINDINKEAWWNSITPDFMRTFPATGHKGSSSPQDWPKGTFSKETGGTMQNERGYYWSCDKQDGTNVYSMKAHETGIYGWAIDVPAFTFSVRLFKDAE